MNLPIILSLFLIILLPHDSHSSEFEFCSLPDGSCQISTASFTGQTSLRVLNILDDSYVWEYSFKFRLRSRDGVLFYTGRMNDLITIEIVDGILLARMDCGSGELVLSSINSGINVVDGQYHSVVFSGDRRHGVLQLDGTFTTEGDTVGSFLKVATTGIIYLGENEQGTGGGLKGCISDLKRDGISMNLLNYNFSTAEFPCTKTFCLDGEICFPDTVAMAGAGYVVATAGSSLWVWDYEIDFKTSNLNGMILHTSRRSDTITIEIVDGKIYALLNNGSGRLTLMIPAVNFADSNWHHLKFSGDRDYGALDVDYGQFQTDGFAPGGFTLSSNDGKLYLGGHMNFNEPERDHFIQFSYFVGCLKGLVVNNQTVNMVTEQLSNENAENSCVDYVAPVYYTHHLCFESDGGCPFDTIHFQDDLFFSLVSRTNYSSWQFSLSIKAIFPDGIILFTAGPSGHISMELSNGHLLARLDCGTGELILSSESSGVDLLDLEWHDVTFSGNGNQAELRIDDDAYVVNGIAPGEAVNVETDGFLYFGGSNIYVHNVTKGLSSGQRFTGCISNAKLDSQSLNSLIPASSTSALIAFPCLRTYCRGDSGSCEDNAIAVPSSSSLKITGAPADSPLLAFSLEFKTSQKDGLILYTGDVNGTDFYSVHLANGYVGFRADIGSGPITITSPVPMHDNQWHFIEVNITSNDVDISLDNDLYLLSGQFAPGDQLLTTDSVLHLGSHPNISDLYNQNKTLASASYEGCVRNLTRDRIPILDINGTKIQYGEAVKCTEELASTFAYKYEAVYCAYDNGLCPVDTLHFTGSTTKGFDVPYMLKDDTWELSLSFKTLEEDAPLLVISDSEEFFIWTGVVAQKLVVIVHSSGTATNFTAPDEWGLPADNKWHSCIFGFHSQHLFVSFDNTMSFEGEDNLAPAFNSSTLKLEIGGSERTNFGSFSFLPTSFEGCLHGVVLPNSVSLPTITEEVSDISEYVCAVPLCTYGDQTCSNDTVAMTGKTWLEIEKSEDKYLWDIYLEFRTELPTGVIAFAGTYSDHILLEVSNGILLLRFDCGSGEAVLSSLISGINIDNGKWHSVHFGANRSHGFLNIDDGMFVVEGNSQGTFQRISSRGLFVGGFKWNSDAEILSGKQNFTGCIRNLTYNEQKINLGEDSKNCENAINVCNVTEKAVTPIETNFCDIEGSECAFGAVSFNGENVGVIERGPGDDFIYNYTLTFRARKPGGLIFFTSRTNNYISLELTEGNIIFRHNPGTGPATISSAGSDHFYDDEKWHTVSFSANKQVATLVVDHTYSVSGSSQGEYERVSTDQKIYLGGMLNMSQVIESGAAVTSMNFTGCLGSLMRDGLPQNLLTQLKKTAISPEYPCLPPFVENSIPTECCQGGETCHMDVTTYVGDGYSHFLIPSEPIRNELRVRISFKTTNPYGLLFYAADMELEKFVTIQMIGGAVFASFDLGSGESVTRTNSSLTFSDGVWHETLFHLQDGIGNLYIDSQFHMSQMKRGQSSSASLGTDFYVGGMNDFDTTLGSEIAFPIGFDGCIKDVYIDDDFFHQYWNSENQANGIKPGMQQIEKGHSIPCYPGSTCPMETVSYDGSSFSRFSILPLEADWKICFQLKTSSQSGLIAYMSDMESDFVSISLVSGRLGVRVKSGDQHKVVDSDFTPEFVNITDSQWHSFEAGVVNEVLFLKVDGVLAIYKESLEFSEVVKTNHKLFIGGVSSFIHDTLAGSHPGVEFAGCIRNVVLNEVNLNQIWHPDLSGNISRPCLVPFESPVNDVICTEEGKFCPLHTIFADDNEYALFESEGLFKSFTLQIEFRSFHPYGVLLYTTKGGEFFIVEIVSNTLVVRFDHGSGQGILTTDMTGIGISDGLWHTVFIEINDKEGSFNLDNGMHLASTFSRGPSLGNDYTTDIFVGGVDHIPFGHLNTYEYRNFSGCIRNVFIDFVPIDLKWKLKHEENIERPCIPRLSTPRISHPCEGPTCSMESTWYKGSSYILASAQVVGDMELSFDFSTRDPFGLLAYTYFDSNSYFLIHLVGGSLIVTVSTGLQPIFVTMESPNINVTNGVTHTLSVTISKDDLVVDLNNGAFTKEAKLQLPPAFIFLNSGNFYLGGHPVISTIHGSSHLYYQVGFSGCMSNIVINREEIHQLWDPAAKEAAEYSCHAPQIPSRAIPSEFCQGACFLDVVSVQPDGYIFYDLPANESFSSSLYFKTRDNYGTILYASFGLYYFLVELVSGKLAFTYKPDFGEPSIVFTEDMSYNFSDSSWHFAQFQLNGTELSVNIDNGNFTTTTNVSRAIIEPVGGYIYLGGVQENHILEGKAFSLLKFAGCMRNFTVNGKREHFFWEEPAEKQLIALECIDPPGMELDASIACSGEDSCDMDTSSFDGNGYIISSAENPGSAWSVEFEMKTIAKYGLMFATYGLPSSNEYLVAELLSGVLVVHWSTGTSNNFIHHDMDYPINDGVWHSFKVEGKERIVTLTIDNGNFSEQVQTFETDFSIDTGTIWYIGGLKTFNVAKMPENAVYNHHRLTGCLRRFYINNKNVDLVTDSFLLASVKYPCCTLGVASFGGSQYGIYNRHLMDDKLEFSFEFKSGNPEGTFVTFGKTEEFFFDAFLQNGQLNIEFNLGGGLAEVTAGNRAYDDYIWHSLSVEVVGNITQVHLDDDSWLFSTPAVQEFKNSDADDYFFVGWAPPGQRRHVGLTGNLREFKWYSTSKDLYINLEQNFGLHFPCVADFVQGAPPPCDENGYCALNTGRYDITSESLFKVQTPEDELNISLMFKTIYPYGVILYNRDDAGTDFISIELLSGRLVARAYSSQEIKEIILGEVSVSDNQWHRVDYSRNNTLMRLSLDNNALSKTIEVGPMHYPRDEFMNVSLSNSYAGDEIAEQQIRSQAEFVGCLREVQFNHFDVELFVKGVRSVNVTYPCVREQEVNTPEELVKSRKVLTAIECSAVSEISRFESFGGMDVPITFLDLSIVASFKTYTFYGIIFHMEDMNDPSHYVSVAVISGYLVFYGRYGGERFSLSHEMGDRFISDGNWHSIGISRSGESILFSLDGHRIHGHVKTVPSLAMFYKLYLGSSGQIYGDGIYDERNFATERFSLDKFRGCIRKIHVSRYFGMFQVKYDSRFSDPDKVLFV